MIEYSELSEQSRKLVDDIQRALRQPVDSPKEVFIANVPNGIEKKKLLTYLTQLNMSQQMYTCYVAGTEQEVHGMRDTILGK